VYHEYIYPLLFLKKGDGYFINGFGSEYDSANDFKLTDFSDDVIREIFAKRPELFKNRSLKKKLIKLGLIDKLPEEYVSIEISPDRVDRYIDGDYTVRKERVFYGEGRSIGVFETILAGDTWDLWDNYDADWKDALEYNADSDSEARIREILVAMAAKNGVEVDEDLSLEDMIEEYDEDQEIIHAIQRAVNDSESDAYADDLYKALKSALEELGTVEKMDDTGVVLHVNVGKYIDDLEEDVYEEISDRCDDKLDCMFDAMMGEWIDKPDFKFNDNYYSPNINNGYFNELLQDRLDEIKVEEINESKVRIKNILRESLVPKVVNKSL
jgi:type III secretion system FlhB-like substrate exporter